MTSPQGNPTRRELLLWLQLLGLAALPLEAAALLLVLAGADPGPLPGLERLFCWALGAVGPAVLLWRLPPDLWSLLLLQVPLKARRADQLRLSALQGALPLRLLAAAGAPLLLPLLWWSDDAAGLAWAWSPLASSPRLVGLLVAAALLALMLWQWQQLVQALWLFSRPAPLVAQTLPLPANEAADRRLNLGLPLLLLAPLEASEAAIAAPAPTAAELAEEHEADPAEEGETSQQDAISPSPDSSPDTLPERLPTSVQPVRNLGHSADKAAGPDATPPAERPPTTDSAGAAAPEDAEDASAAADSVSAGGVSGIINGGVAVTPKQGAEQAEGDDLNQQV